MGPISVSADGTQIRGIALNAQLYYRRGLQGNWERVGGFVSRICVSGTGRHWWALTEANLLYYHNVSRGSWVRVPFALRYLREPSR